LSSGVRAMYYGVQNNDMLQQLISLVCLSLSQSVCKQNKL